MKKYLLGGKGNFYKANLHMHTTISDGQLSPEEVKKRYMEQGYSIVAYTDHEVILSHNDLSDENFLAITSYEGSVNKREKIGEFEFVKTYHLNYFAKDKNAVVCPCFTEKNVWMEHTRAYVTDEMRKVDYPLAYSVEQINDMIEKANEAGFLVSYNHPVWSQQEHEDYADLKGLWGVEVYNHLSAVMGYPDTVVPFVTLLRRGEHVLPLATDDAHGEQMFGGFCMIEAESLEYKKVLSAMEKGDLYSSTGPKIEEISLDGAKLCVRCSAASEIMVNSERRLVYGTRGEEITEAEFDISSFLKQNEKYPEKSPSFLRVTVTDKQGKQAWSRAYFENELK
ncbi:MAG: hypothetical protein IJV80_03265 [Clostridia bacterium]|nr:hypothetical protein [Clostridia bacterium]